MECQTDSNANMTSDMSKIETEYYEERRIPLQLDEFESTDMKPRGLPGLSNMGNTCYMNSALQSLSNCTPLTQFFLKCQPFVQGNENGKTSVSVEYCKLMHNIWGRERLRVITPSALARSVRLVYGQFRGYAQQDSQEFLRCIMDRLHDELKRPVMKFPSKRNQTSKRKSHVKHNSKKLLGGNGSSEDQPMDIERNSDQDRMENDASSDTKETEDKTATSYHSIITDIFNGKLMSSVQCLACHRISTTVENFQDLSLPIPGKDDLMRIHSQCSSHVVSCSPNSYAQGWFASFYDWCRSWFIGPQVSLQDCLAAFFAKDELKGDNMYNCEKCNKLRNGVKYLRLHSLPEILCIHLKRFRHEMYYSSKISSYVLFPVNGLDLKPFLGKDGDSKFTTYDLCAVITHFGNVGGGHYVAYAKNSINNKWYEFNDSSVYEVSEYQVENAEAYVLFYNKRSSSEQQFRAHIRDRMSHTHNSGSTEGVYLSKEWLNRFSTCAEPGEISNYDFLCRHGDVPPALMPQIKSFVMFVSTKVWNELHARFGGGPEVKSLAECKTCKELAARREYESNLFDKLHEEFQKESEPDLAYCLSISWHRRWKAFTKGDEQEPPGEIDNTNILELKDSEHVLRQDSDYGFISIETWEFLHRIYGGGPEFKIEKRKEKRNERSKHERKRNDTADDKMETEINSQ
eukprot:Seg1757.2 transcript_id=Seg1757.2/GoldUCD/mRNA.D3Y31 product="Ubiquitin carboxyl-terminal hydrolase 20" protein_id=Seg1757.2/GoldUCD/D3Y31